MSIYKKFSKSDISITPFIAHKQNTLISSSLSSKGGSYYSSSFPTIAFRNGSGFEWANSGSDINQHKKYFQLDHLFYKNSKIDYVNKFSTLKYFDHYRILHNKVNILSLPYKTIGSKIKLGSFSLTTGSISLKDDSKGHIYDTQFNLGDLNFKNEKFRIFYLGPENGHKAYNLKLKNGYEIINFNSSYSSGRTGILDNSFFFNKLEYNNTTFSPQNIGGGDYPVINLKGSPYENNLKPIVFEHRPKGGLINVASDLQGVSSVQGQDASENAIDFGIGPFGETELLWENYPTKSQADGGWNSNKFAPDTGSGYMFTCFFKRVDWGAAAYEEGSTYWGVRGTYNQPSDKLMTATSGLQSNNYFQNGDPSIEGFGDPNTTLAKSASLDRWLLTVGYIAPSGSDVATYISQSVTYDVTSCLENGFKNVLTASWNGGNNKTYAWTSESIETSHRAYKYYTHEITASALNGDLPQGGNIKTQEIARPAIFKLDGTQPSIEELLTPQKRSSIVSPHHSKYNFNSSDDFALSFLISSSYITQKNSYVEESDNFKRYIFSKSTTKKTILTPNISVPLNTTGSSQPVNIDSEPQYPFEVYYQSSSLYFNRFDGTTLSSVSAMVSHSNSAMIHVVCQKTGSNLELYINGNKLATSTDNTTLTQNTADLFIGSKGEKGLSYKTNYFKGSIAQIMIFDDSLSQTQINNLSQSIDNKPYVGNIFYNNGLATITKPNYQKVLNPGEGNQNFNLQYQGTHLIYENEYQCMVEQHEYDYTMNPTVRKNRSEQDKELANFATESNFRPYVTTIGLYNENQELLAVGKLGQAIRMNDETDMTFVVRYDT